jgi:DNA polymerase-3 subunit alpha
MGIAVLLPDINESNWAFTVVGDTIRFGLGAVKGLGESAVEAILEARRRVGRFRDLLHFAEEVEARSLNRKVFESLIKAGAFDELGEPRWVLWASLDRVLDCAQRRAGARRRTGVAVRRRPGWRRAAARAPPPWAEPIACGSEALGFFLTGNRWPSTKRGSASSPPPPPPTSGRQQRAR